MNFLSRTLFVLPVLMLVQNADGFDGREHERISDNAILIALSYWVAMMPNGTRDDDLDVCEFLTAKGLDEVRTLVRSCSTNPKAITYGGTVRLIDEMLRPDQLFEHQGAQKSNNAATCTTTCYAENYTDLNGRFNERWEARQKYRAVASVAAGFRALSNNDVHFQNALLEKLEDYRRQAVTRAPEYLYDALLNNAIADHFLMDFLSPGHILWPRNQSHDNVALAFHDRTNQRGAYFEVDGVYWDQYLKPIAEFLREMNPEWKIYRQIDDNWLKRRPDMPATCGKLRDKLHDEGGDLREGLECLKQSSGARRIFIYGDGLISKSPAQQALLIIVQADRIYKLFKCLGSQACAKTVLDQEKSLTSLPISSFDETFDELLVPEAGLWFGKYRFDCNDCGPPPPFDSTEDDAFQGSVSGILMLGGGGQTAYRDVGAGRFQFSIEYIPLALIANHSDLRNAVIHRPPKYCEFWSYCNLGFAVGIDYLHDNDFNATGGGVRLVKAVPSVNIQLSPYLKYLNYRFPGGSEWGLSWGVRVDWGFSVGSFYIALGKDNFLTDTQQLDSTGMVSFGVGFGVPTARLRKWLKHNRSYMPGGDYIYDESAGTTP